MNLKQKLLLTNNSIFISIIIKPYRFLKHILVELIYSLLSKFGKSQGVTTAKYNSQLVVCLTTIPERINKVHLCIESLMRQSLKPNKIILWITEKIFDYQNEALEENIPRQLLRLKSRGLEIKYCKDIGPFSKTINTLKNYPNCILVVADDDVYYPKNWLIELYTSYLNDPQYIHCHQARWIKKNDNDQLSPYNNWKEVYDFYQGPSYNIFPITKGGCLYPPKSLSKELFNENTFLKLCPIQDDVWLTAMSLLNQVKCKKVRPFPIGLVPIRGTKKKSLMSENIGHNKNDSQVKAVFDKYKLYSLIE